MVCGRTCAKGMERIFGQDGTFKIHREGQSKGGINTMVDNLILGTCRLNDMMTLLVSIGQSGVVVAL